MKVVWKYTLSPTMPPLPEQEHRVLVPQGAQILKVDAQRGALTLWALVDPSAPSAYRSFLSVLTGHKFDPTGAHFINTIQWGNLVYHIFEMCEDDGEVEDRCSGADKTENLRCRLHLGHPGPCQFKR